MAAAAIDGTNIMGPSIALAHAGWHHGRVGRLSRGIFGEYRAPTGVACSRGAGGGSDVLRAIAAKLRDDPAGPPRLLVAKPGLDGHSNGAEQIAVAARDAGMEVIYEGIRLTPEQIAAAARDEDVEAIGLSILLAATLKSSPRRWPSFEPLALPPQSLLVGSFLRPTGIAARCRGRRRIHPKDFELGTIITKIVELIQDYRAN
ncbi:MAG: cobalamin-dependent protein [Acidimicrobiales bacterium]